MFADAKVLADAKISAKSAINNSLPPPLSSGFGGIARSVIQSVTQLEQRSPSTPSRFAAAAHRCCPQQCRPPPPQNTSPSPAWPLPPPSSARCGGTAPATSSCWTSRSCRPRRSTSRCPPTSRFERCSWPTGGGAAAAAAVVDAADDVAAASELKHPSKHTHAHAQQHTHAWASTPLQIRSFPSRGWARLNRQPSPA